MLSFLPYAVQHATNDAAYQQQQRERTVPIPSTITPVPGYPLKLVVYKIAASKFWQVRCWVVGRTHTDAAHTLRACVLLKVLHEPFMSNC